MPALVTLGGILLILVAIPFGLMLAPLALGTIVIALGWRHVAAPLHDPLSGAGA